MTHITIYKSTNGGIVGFRSAGHAGYAEEGSDIICSAVSILTFNTINSIEKFTDAKFDVSVDEEAAVVDFPAPLGPTITTSSPFSISKFALSNALMLFSPTIYSLTTFLNSM